MLLKKIHNLIKSFEKKISSPKAYSKRQTLRFLEISGIKNYTVNGDLIVDVDGDVHLNDHMDELPIQFGTINGHFNCYSIGLKTLKGAPYKVLGNFECHHNKLSSLEHSPQYVGKHFDCSHNELKSLNGCPSIVKKDFICSYNDLSELTSLDCSIGGIFEHNVKFEDEHHEIKILKNYYQKNESSYSYPETVLLLQHDEFQSILSKVRLKENLDKTLINGENSPKDKIPRIKI